MLDSLLLFAVGFIGGYFFCLPRLNELQHELNKLRIDRLHKDEPMTNTIKFQEIIANAPERATHFDDLNYWVVIDGEWHYWSVYGDYYPGDPDQDIRKLDDLRENLKQAEKIMDIEENLKPDPELEEHFAKLNAEWETCILFTELELAQHDIEQQINALQWLLDNRVTEVTEVNVLTLDCVDVVLLNNIENRITQLRAQESNA